MNLRESKKDLFLYFAYIYILFNQFIFTCTRFQDWGGQYGLFETFAYVMEFVLLDYAIWNIVKEPDKKIKLVLTVITVCGALCDGDEVRTLCLMLTAFYGQPMKKALKIWIITIASLFAFTAFCSLVGILEFRVNIGGRYEFGMIWYTDFAYTCLFLFLAFAVYRDGRFRLFEYPVLYALALVVFRLTQAKNTTICMLLFTTMCLVSFIYGKLLDPENENNTLLKKRCDAVIYNVQKYFLDYSFIWGLLLFAFMLSIKDRVALAAEAHDFLGSYADRLGFSYEVLQNPVTPFGQYFYEGQDPYFMVDQFYPRLFVRHGAVLFVVVIAVFTYILIRARRERMNVIYFAMLIMALYAQTDLQIIDCSRDFMFPLAFAVWAALPFDKSNRQGKNQE